MKEKINGGKLVSSLVIYIFGYVLITVMSALLISLLLSLLIEIPVVKNLIGYLFNENPFLIKLFPVVLGVYVPYFISGSINNKTERTHHLSTFIFGICLISLQGLFFIINLLCGDFEFINLFQVFIGIGLIVSGKKNL